MIVNIMSSDCGDLLSLSEAMLYPKQAHLFSFELFLVYYSTHNLAVGFWPGLTAEKLHCQFLLTFCGFILMKEQQFGSMPAGKLTSLPERGASHTNSLLLDNIERHTNQPTNHPLPCIASLYLTRRSPRQVNIGW